jgi:beta-glucuronidase
MSTLDLTGLWRFQPDPAGVGEAQGYAELGTDDHRWREVHVPVDFETCHPALDTYEGAGWFRRWVTVPEIWQGQRVTLKFEGVNAHARTWVNGVAVGGTEDPFLPFELDLQGVLSFGRENLIAVRIDNERRAADVPGLRRGWRNYGGFLREPVLVATDPCYIDRIHTVAEPAPDGGRLDVQAIICNGRGAGAEVLVHVEVADGQGMVVAGAAADPHLVPVRAEVAVGLSITLPEVQAWTPETPYLYAVQVVLEIAGEAVDVTLVRTGFRTIEVGGGRLRLNGEPIFLTGFNRHEDSPDTNMCPDLEGTRRDLLAMKEAGANFVRLCHYPHHPGELDLCDELGLLAMAEIPLYWWGGKSEASEVASTPDTGEIVAATKLANAKRQLETMIRRDRNHPAVIFWSVSNETQEEHIEVAAGNRELIAMARGLDPTRLAVHVSDHWRTVPNFDADDVICVNAYPSVGPLAGQGRMDYDLDASTAFWRDALAELHAQYPDKPILVAEFGYTSFLDVVDNAFSGELHARVLEAEFAGMHEPYICGATIWCWADHAWPPATFDFCGYLAISPYGVLTRDRRRKPPYWTARRLFREKRGLPEREPAAARPEFGPAGFSLYMVRPHMHDIPQVSLPEGFRFRALHPDEGGLWTDIERDAEDFFPIEQTLFANQFGDDPQALRWRSYIVEDERGVGVATITSWYNRAYKDEEYGQIHWVAVRRAYWNRGLGKAMMTHALNQMAQWHDKAFLGTQSKRLPAIKVYLDFGFVPDLDSPFAREAWREVKAELKHPVLEAMVL